MCIIKLDFQGALDNISHDYLDEVINKYGFSTAFRMRLQNIYKQATASVQINGYRYTSIKTKGSIRQGCPIGIIL
jgi:hypothetical protein